MDVLLPPQLSPETIAWELATPLSDRKKLGQYMTPKSIRDFLLQQVPFKDGDKVLDPAVGTGEFLKSVQEFTHLSGLELHGWDVNDHVLRVASQMVPEAHLMQHSLFDSQEEYLGFFDVVIGNPPYFEKSLSAAEKTMFTSVRGRANMYGLFFERYLPVVKEGGYLGFIVPPSMNSGVYFDRLRSFILKHSDVEFVGVIRDNSVFAEALTAVQAVVLKRNSSGATPGNRFVVNFGEFTGSPEAPTVLSDRKNVIMECLAGRDSIAGLGYKVLTGPIEWNIFRSELYSTQVDGSHPLLYAKDISVDNTIVYHKSLSGRRFLKIARAPYQEEALIVNRVVGALKNPILKVARMDGSEPFYVENHVNVIVKDPTKVQKVTMPELYDRILNFSRLSEYLQALTGNTQLSTKELMFLFPV